ncbi:magnesium transporter [Thiorhodovibrio frisius]|uniref:Magnesium transporter MgtE n=1 Tax=Thiorhodovibrio frisius TaxID=631362 RepID=H8Z8D4_9GAMM|nr:magnesium transporter [Thiorhodovibrio frisius]EIC19339.1 Mg2+ transporter MgtE [Thiorhodovibrio frisius]WPL22362.1 Magnesium transporter MgtE [Thiorhodovibrio frisius]
MPNQANIPTSPSASDEQAPLRWTHSATGELSSENKLVIKKIGQLIKAGDRDRVRAIVRRWRPRDVIELMVNLPLKRARKLFFYMPAGAAAKVVAELNDDFRAALLEDATIDRLVEILDSLDPETGADALEELPEEVQERLLPQLQRANDILELKTYREESAGSIMTRKLVAVPPDWTLDQVVSEVRRNASVIKKISVVYVVDHDRRLLGYLKLRDLLLSPKERRAAEAMRTDPIVVSSEMDQEEVVRTTQNHALTSVPVVDTEHRLLGRITSDELQRVTRDEAEEDAHLMSGLSPEARPDAPVFSIVKTRLPWLLAGLLGATLSGTIVGSYEDEIAAAAILASFIPIVMSMAGNAGIQAATVAIQGIATGTLWIGDLPWRLGRELLGAMVNGLTAAIVLAVVVFGLGLVIELEAPLMLAGTAGLALFFVTLLAVAMGASVPMLLKHFGVDPAMATGIFITTGNDIIAVLVFFLVATNLYL